MQEIESAVRDLGGSAMQGIDHAVKGLNSGTLEGTLPFIIGVLILVVVVKCFSLPFRLIWNGICGAVALWFIKTNNMNLSMGIWAGITAILIALPLIGKKIKTAAVVNPTRCSGCFPS